ncbi:MAG: hypothetical protein IJK30_08475 [Ruminococcus sp.]|nr:hypothetical protein [Ruminococcus sp.]
MEGYYIIEVRLNNKLFFLLWKDERFFINDNNLLVCHAQREIEAFITENKIQVSENVERYNLDGISELLLYINQSDKARELLDYWNFFSDLSQTVGIDFFGDTDNDEVSELYNKLVMGSNFEILHHEEYHPVLDENEQELISFIFNNGIELFKKCVSDYLRDQS